VHKKREESCDIFLKGILLSSDANMLAQKNILETVSKVMECGWEHTVSFLCGRLK
jgi:hypothetical protein